MLPLETVKHFKA